MKETNQQPEYTPTDVVRVSIVMEQASTLEQGFSTANVAQNPQALAYRENLRQAQATTTARIEQAVGSRLDVQWNLTLAANLISANVAYGDIETIQSVSGVKDVFLETRYEPCVVDEVGTADPNMATSRNMIGSSAAYARAIPVQGPEWPSLTLVWIWITSALMKLLLRIPLSLLEKGV